MIGECGQERLQRTVAWNIFSMTALAGSLIELQRIGPEFVKNGPKNTTIVHTLYHRDPDQNAGIVANINDCVKTPPHLSTIDMLKGSQHRSCYF
jgi:hypothetical protein